MSETVATSQSRADRSGSTSQSRAPGRGSGIQLKRVLSGRDFEAQQSTLAPVQRSQDGAIAPAPPRTNSNSGGRPPVQRRAIQRMEVQQTQGATPPPPPPSGAAAPASGGAASTSSAQTPGSAPGAAPAGGQAPAQAQVRRGAVPGAGDLEILEENYNQMCAQWITDVQGQSNALLDATVELQRLYVFYDAKYKSGSWRHRIMSIFKTPPATPPPASIIDDAVAKALQLQAVAGSVSRDRAGADRLKGVYDAAQMAHDAAWLTMEQYRTNIGEAAGTFWKNAGMKVAIGIGGAIVGIGAGAAAAAAAPALGAGVVVAKVATAMVGSGVGGAFSGAVSSGVRQHMQEGDIKAGELVRESIMQGTIGAGWAVLGGPLAAVLGPMLPPDLQAKVGSKMAEYIMKATNVGGGLALKGKIADAVRGKSDEAPFDANEIAYTVAQQMDLQQLAAGINAAWEAENPQQAQAPTTPAAAPAAAAAPGGGAQTQGGSTRAPGTPPPIPAAARSGGGGSSGASRAAGGGPPPPPPPRR